jgi:recombination protein RecT
MNNLTIPNERKLSAQFTARRISESLRFGAEKEHLATILRNDTKGNLARCQLESLGDVMLQAAVTGLTLNPLLGYAYVIPQGDKATLTPSYKGMMFLVSRAGTLRGAPQANVVREKDPLFEVTTVNGVRSITHTENRGERGKITHAYCIAHFADGSPPHVEVMDAHDLAAVQKASTSRNAKGGQVWRSDFAVEMCKKSVMRRAWKWWPKDAAMQHAVEVMNTLDPIDFGRADPDTASGLCIDEDQALALRDQCSAAGVPDGQIGAWLERLAKRHGLAQISDLSASKFDDVQAELGRYLKAWAEREAAK